MQTLRIVLVFIAFAACKTNTTPTPIEVANNDSVPFFEVARYINSQVADVQKTPYFIYEKTVTGGRLDSVAIDANRFTQLAGQFANPDISSAGLKQYYTENVFLDKSTNSYNLNYSTTNKTLEVQNLDVLLEEDGTTLKRIFIRKYFNYNNDSTAIEQLSWKPNERFQVSRMVQLPGQPEQTRQTTVVWNEK